MATYQITPAMNRTLIALLDGPAQAITLGSAEEVTTLVRAKLAIAYTADDMGGTALKLTPAGRRWALIKRQYGNTHPIPRAGGA